MIKFFRKVRQNLLSEGKTGKYFKYAIGEIILVVIGILIALQLNQNVENKKDNHTRQEYYEQLLEDLIKDKEFADETIKSFSIDHANYASYLEIYRNPKLQPVQVYEKLMTLNIVSGIISFNSNTIESLRSSGEIILIPLEIRNKLIDLLRLQDRILKDAQLNDTGKSNILQNLGMLRGGSTLDGNLKDKPQLKTYLGFDKNMPQIIVGLDAALKWKDFSESSSITYLKLMIQEIETTIDLIELEMKK
ncbi:MAG: hypothetical protein MUO53_14495 [Maribacter sp.]|nr:hypothetical protein [Maribacter sp.]